jgi:hypothetical protein
MTMKGRRSIVPRLLIAAVCAFAIAGAGCSGNVRFVEISSKPLGATIYVNGERVGVTRYEKVRLTFGTADSRACIQLVKHRYKPILQYYQIDEVPEKPQMFLLEDD